MVSDKQQSSSESLRGRAYYDDEDVAALNGSITSSNDLPEFATSSFYSQIQINDLEESRRSSRSLPQNMINNMSSNDEGESEFNHEGYHLRIYDPLRIEENQFYKWLSLQFYSDVRIPESEYIELRRMLLKQNEIQKKIVEQKGAEEDLSLNKRIAQLDLLWEQIRQDIQLIQQKQRWFQQKQFGLPQSGDYLQQDIIKQQTSNTLKQQNPSNHSHLGSFLQQKQVINSSNQIKRKNDNSNTSLSGLQSQKRKSVNIQNKNGQSFLPKFDQNNNRLNKLKTTEPKKESVKQKGVPLSEYLKNNGSSKCKHLLSDSREDQSNLSNEPSNDNMFELDDDSIKGGKHVVEQERPPSRMSSPFAITNNIRPIRVITTNISNASTARDESNSISGESSKTKQNPSYLIKRSQSPNKNSIKQNQNSSKQLSNSFRRNSGRTRNERNSIEELKQSQTTTTTTTANQGYVRYKDFSPPALFNRS